MNTRTRIDNWLTEPPADLRPDSTDEEIRAISQRILDDAISRHLPLQGSHPMMILLRMRADLSGLVWSHSFECDACGKYAGCRISYRALSATRQYGDEPRCPQDRTTEYGEDIAVWKYLGARQVPIEGGDAP